MKALLEKHACAIELREKGWCYAEIKEELMVSKSSLSLWLHTYPLTEQQIKALRADREVKRIESYKRTMALKRKAHLGSIYKSELITLLPLDARELYIAGLMLYWGEGLKATWSAVSISNTNPYLIRLSILWLISCCGVIKSQLKIRLHLYSDMDIAKESAYWSKILDISLVQFNRPYIKKSTRFSINEKGSFGHGTCDLIVHNTRLKEKIMMGIKVMSDLSVSDTICESMGQWRNG